MSRERHDCRIFFFFSLLYLPSLLNANLHLLSSNNTSRSRTSVRSAHSFLSVDESSKTFILSSDFSIDIISFRTVPFSLHFVSSFVKITMKQSRICLLLLSLVCSILAEDEITTPQPEWNGDPNVCLPDNSPPNPSDPPYPIFPTKAEFTLEMVQVGHLSNTTSPSVLTLFQYLYDYDANQLVMIRNTGSMIDLEYYYYNIPRKATYYRGETCVVTNILFDVENGSIFSFPSGLISFEVTFRFVCRWNIGHHG